MAVILRSAFVWLSLTTASFAADLSIVIPTQTGGYMVYARVFAQHLQKYTDQNVVIKAMPGAASIAAANYLYSVAPKDGSVIGMITTRAAIQFLAQPETIKYDLSKFEWIGSAVDGRKEPFVLWSKAGSQPLISGSDSASPINHISLLNSVLGWNVKEINGYQNSTETKLAFEKGEINLVAYNLTGIRTTNPDWLNRSDIMPLVQYGAGNVRHPSLSLIPTVMELTKLEDDKKLIEAFERILVLNRPFIAPPGIPAPKLAQLRTLFEQTVTDPKHQEDAAKIGVILSPIYWHETEKIVQDMVRTPLETVSRLKQF